MIRDIGFFEMNPEPEPLGHFFPLPSVAKNALDAAVDERLDPVRLDLFLTVDAQFLADFDFDGQPVVSQMAATADPLAVAEAIGLRERRLVAYAGLNPADVTRASGDPRSGYSLAVTREGQREAQRRYSPVFGPVDEEVLSLTATAIRLGGGPTIAEGGWRVTHQMLPASPDERDAERKDVLELERAGLITKTEARARLLGETEAEAATKLAAITAARPAITPADPEPV
jgi:hypothetical protein